MFINQEGSPFYIFRHCATISEREKFSKISSFFPKNVLRFLSLRYSADLRRSRLVETGFGSLPLYAPPLLARYTMSLNISFYWLLLSKSQVSQSEALILHTCIKKCFTIPPFDALHYVLPFCYRGHGERDPRFLI